MTAGDLWARHRRRS